jgi:hypothetical protein
LGNTHFMKAIGVIAVLVLVALPGARVEAASTKSQATLRLVSKQPLVLRGTRFVDDERVRVTVYSQGNRSVKRVRAVNAGRFVVRFSDVFVDRCSGLRALAVGDEGSRAWLKLPDPACPPTL